MISIALSPDETRVASSSQDETIRVWSVATGEEIARLTGVGYAVKAEFQEDARSILLGLSDSSIRRWDTTSNKLEVLYVGRPNSTATAVTFRQDGSSALVALKGSKLVLVNLESGAELLELEGHDNNIGALAISPDNLNALSSSSNIFGYDSSVRLWDLHAGVLLRRYDLYASLGPVNLAFTSDGRQALIGGGNLQLWSVPLRTLDELVSLTYAKRDVHEFTCSERELYRVQPNCNESAVPVEPMQHTQP